MPKFFPPTVEEGPAALGYFFSRYKLTRGVSILKIGSTYKKYRTPSTDQIESASEYYAGGHEYEVTDNQKTALLASGLGLTEANFG